MKRIILSKNGATLVELLVGLAIGGIISAFAVGIYIQGLKISRLITSDTFIYESVRKLFYILPADIRSITEVSSLLVEKEGDKKNLMKNIKIFEGNDSAYTKEKISYPSDTLKISTVLKKDLKADLHSPKCIVEYYWQGLFEDRVLMRKATYIDNEGTIKSTKPKAVGKDIIGMNIRYYKEIDGKGTWVDEWKDNNLPNQVEISLYALRKGEKQPKIFKTNVVIPN